MSKKYFDHELFTVWADGVVSGQVKIPRAHPGGLRAVKSLKWASRSPADAGSYENSRLLNASEETPVVIPDGRGLFWFLTVFFKRCGAG